MERLWTPPLLLLCAALIAVPAAAEESAEDIVRTSQHKGYHGNSIQQMDLSQTTKSGAKKPLTLTMSTRVDGEAIRSHAIFIAPEEMKGVQFVSVADGGPTQRWMYMPLGDSLTTIDSSRRTAPFMGTDFTHEDLELGDPDAGTHTLLGSETITVGGQAVECYQIESIPNADQGSAYARLLTWIEKGSYAPRQVLLFAADDPATEYKRLTFEAVAVQGGAVFPTTMLMENLKKSTSTRIEVTEYRLDVPADELPDALFDPEQLRTRAAQ